MSKYNYGDHLDDQRFTPRNYNLGNGVSLESQQHDYSGFYGDEYPKEDLCNINDRVRGVRGTERGEHFGKGPKNWQRSDRRICDDACEALYRNHRVDASNIEVEVREGVLFLRGPVNSRIEKKEAEESVEFIRGVRDVFNELDIHNGAS
jgi:osmotically-inducible protein OsmY